MQLRASSVSTARHRSVNTGEATDYDRQPAAASSVDQQPLFCLLLPRGKKKFFPATGADEGSIMRMDGVVTPLGQRQEVALGAQYSQVWHTEHHFPGYYRD